MCYNMPNEMGFKLAFCTVMKIETSPEVSFHLLLNADPEHEEPWMTRRRVFRGSVKCRQRRFAPAMIDISLVVERWRVN